MKNFLLKNIIIADPKSSWFGKKAEILVKQGVIDEVGAKIKTDVKSVDGNEALVFPGWIDTLSYCGAPGYEEHEEFNTLAQTALYGGFTTIATVFGNEGDTFTGSHIEGLLNFVKNLPIQILPLGAVTENRTGQNLAELYDMELQGATGFFDGVKQPLNNSLVVVLADYAHLLNKPVYYWPWNKNEFPGALMNQSEVSTSLGLKGFPQSMEFNELYAQISRIEKAEHKTFFPYNTSSQNWKDNKNTNLNFGVPIYNLVYTDTDLRDFHENFKILPPLRSKNTVSGIVKSIKIGTNLNINSNHFGLDKESKEREFQYASYGAASLQVVGSELLKALGYALFLEKAADLLSYSSSSILNIPTNEIKKGVLANLTVFNTKEKWTLNDKSNKAKCRNYPAWETEITGRSTFVVSNGVLNNLIA